MLEMCLNSKRNVFQSYYRSGLPQGNLWSYSVSSQLFNTFLEKLEMEVELELLNEKEFLPIYMD